MMDGTERLIAGINELTEYRIRTSFDVCHKYGVESPIEKYFLIAVYEVCLAVSAITTKVNQCSMSKSSIDEQELEVGRIHVWAQVKAIDWLADFVLGTLSADGKRCFALVECDGHDFHERTKEQAERDRQRDRRVQEKGWRIFRFTGSELYRNSTGIALNEVLNGWAKPLWDGQP